MVSPISKNVVVRAAAWKDFVHSKKQLMAIGVACGFAAAILYTAANICLRRVVHVDPIWVSAIKALPTLLMVLPLIARRMLLSLPLWTTRSDAAWLVLTGLIAQIFGNIAFQWSLGIIGIAISVPMILSSMLVGGAIIGSLVLGEPVKPRTMVAVGCLILATIALSLGATQAVGGSSLLPNASGWQIGAAVAGNLISGVAYAILGTMMRRGMKAGMPLASTLFILSSVGTSLLTVLSLAIVGQAEMLATSTSDLQTMFAAGTFNALAFLLLAKALQQVPVLYVQMLNVTQTAMAAAAGWLLFGEQITPLVQVGLLLTAAGLLIAGTRSRRNESPVEQLKE